MHSLPSSLVPWPSHSARPARGPGDFHKFNLNVIAVADMWKNRRYVGKRQVSPSATSPIAEFWIIGLGCEALLASNSHSLVRGTSGDSHGAAPVLILEVAAPDPSEAYRAVLNMHACVIRDINAARKSLVDRGKKSK